MGVAPVRLSDTTRQRQGPPKRALTNAAQGHSPILRRRLTHPDAAKPKPTSARVVRLGHGAQAPDELILVTTNYKFYFEWINDYTKKYRL